MFNRVVEATFDENFVVSVTAVSRYVIQKSPWDFTLNKSDIISVPENGPGTKKRRLFNNLLLPRCLSVLDGYIET